MEYRNTRTGCVIETGCRLSGGDWQPVKERRAADSVLPVGSVRDGAEPPEASRTQAGKKPPQGTSGRGGTDGVLPRGEKRPAKKSGKREVRRP